jgi:hypothetical protein
MFKYGKKSRTRSIYGHALIMVLFYALFTIINNYQKIIKMCVQTIPRRLKSL